MSFILLIVCVKQYGFLWIWWGGCERCDMYIWVGVMWSKRSLFGNIHSTESKLTSTVCNVWLPVAYIVESVVKRGSHHDITGVVGILVLWNGTIYLLVQWRTGSQLYTHHWVWRLLRVSQWRAYYGVRGTRVPFTQRFSEPSVLPSQINTNLTWTLSNC